MSVSRSKGERDGVRKRGKEIKIERMNESEQERKREEGKRCDVTLGVR